MFFNYKNCTFSFSGIDILASNVNMSLDTSNAPVYNEEFKKNSYSYIAEDTVDTNFSISYYLTGKDFVKEYLLGASSEQGISGNFCGLYFENGYITNYSIKGSPDSLAKVDVEVKVFEPLKGAFSATAPINRPEFTPLNFSSFYLSGNLDGTPFDSNGYNFTNFSYQYQREVQKYNKEGSSAFDQSGRAYLGKRSQSLSFEIDNFNYSLPYSGVPCSFYASLQTGSQPLDTLSFAGIVSSKRSSVEAQGYIRSEFSLRQDFSHFKPVITDFTPRVILPGATVTINGSNFINVKKIFFGNTEATSFNPVSTSLITAVAPISLKGAAAILIDTEETSSSSIFNFKTSVLVSDIRLSLEFQGL
jgi:hypothetical protein